MDVICDTVTAAGLPDTIRQELVRSLDDFFPIELLASRAAKRVRGDSDPRSILQFWQHSNYLRLPVEQLADCVGDLSGRDVETLKADIDAGDNISYVYQGPWAGLMS